ncbi:conserved exported hypothetical protein [Frankia canadensis]|uniref:DUF11 domain-containing protein n=1 Tax=Frankia canadensis TaxID=1836972 RepID=A0A2I2KYT2_9ACTN|nr:DUF11 domain-containing protein [Frankia canadensis]SNQ50832.1 conserved exported hypothetical protein [Frankia canadensis]SOU58122.1 conserved exported hypothetical protein [Frankia canadensis]
MSVLCLRKVRAGVVLAAALLGGPLFTFGMLATSVPALAADAPSPPDEDAAGVDLAIGIDDGHTSVAVGDRVTYTVKIRNIGTVDADDLVVTQTLPAGVRFGSADRDGVISAGTVTWHTDLAAGRDTAVVVHGEVAKLPPGQLRLASVACATAHGDSRPIVCAADSDRLPAGGAAGASGAGSHAAGGPPGWLVTLYVGAGVVAALLVGIVARRRWSSRRRARPRPDDQWAVAPGPGLDEETHQDA